MAQHRDAARVEITSEGIRGGLFDRSGEPATVITAGREDLAHAAGLSVKS